MLTLDPRQQSSLQAQLLRRKNIIYDSHIEIETGKNKQTNKPAFVRFLLFLLFGLFEFDCALTSSVKQRGLFENHQLCTEEICVCCFTRSDFFAIDESNFLQQIILTVATICVNISKLCFVRNKHEYFEQVGFQDDRLLCSLVRQAEVMRVRRPRLHFDDEYAAVDQTLSTNWPQE
jgi:hypothetical protein